MSYLMEAVSYRMLIVIALLVASLAVIPSCSGGVDPQLGARLIFEQEIADGLKGQVILQDMDLLNDKEDEQASE